jgi:hypothetical protein
VAVSMAKLNLQEKRRVEDLVFSEIDTAIREYSSSRHTEYDKLRQYLRHLSGVNSMVDPPQFSHVGHHLIDKKGIGQFRKQF